MPISIEALKINVFNPEINTDLLKFRYCAMMEMKMAEVKK